MNLARFLLVQASVLVAASAFAGRELPPPVYTASTERFWVHYTREGLPEAEVAIQCADDCLARVEARLGMRLKGRVDLYLAATQRELEELAGGPEDLFLEGQAFPSQRAIIMRGKITREATCALLAHELVHLALAQRLSPAGVEAPRWLDEGLAELVADEVTPGEHRRYPGQVTGGLLPIASLDTAFPRDPPHQNLAYAQSRSFVEFLEQRTGDRGLSRLIAALAQSGSIEDAFPAAYGRTLEQLEAEWAPGFEVVQARPWSVDVGTAIFMSMTVLFIVAVLVRWRRRQTREALEEDADLEPDEYPYWHLPDDD